MPSTKTGAHQVQKYSNKTIIQSFGSCDWREKHIENLLVQIESSSIFLFNNRQDYSFKLINVKFGGLYKINVK